MSMYSTTDAFDIYVYYLALKRHFTSNYDFFKYNGKVKANAMSFENRKDKFFFYKLSKKKEAKDSIILANMLANPNAWAGELLDDKAESIYKEWIKRKQSLTYQFKSDIINLDDDFNDNFVVHDGQHPRLLKLYMMNDISLETLVMICDITNCIGHWEKNISDTIVFPDINKLVRKYRPFLDYDKPKMRKILLDKYNET